ncbi:MAG: HAD family hydrolase [Actinobacteria bacterium]|nr:MAG: HAD family hydrolase [Actinomycetota bacterium]
MGHRDRWMGPGAVRQVQPSAQRDRAVRAKLDVQAFGHLTSARTVVLWSWKKSSPREEPYLRAARLDAPLASRLVTLLERHPLAWAHMATASATVGPGLSSAEAARRREERGETRGRHSSRSYRSIFLANALTIPNAVLVVFGVLTIVFDSWKDALFLAVVVANIAIGTFQEIRSKRALDQLAALVAPEAVVVRDGTDVQVQVEEVVVGDLVRLAPGDQVVADGRLVSADGLALDEANLTGESELSVRGPGDPVWSGSFAVEGTGLYEATAVGPHSRAERLTATARSFRHPRSPLERANDRLLVGLVVLSIPLAIGLLASVLLRVRGGNAQVQTIVAGLANLIPEGLILLLSLTAAVSAYKFAQRRVLAQQLNAIESLASVNTLVTDKTGTLTEPRLRLAGLVPAAGVDEETLGRELARYAASSPSRNATLQAVADAGLADVKPSAVEDQVPFSSRRRWSALDLGDERLVLGAPERVAGSDDALTTRAREEAKAGRRVLAIGHFRSPLETNRREPPFPADVQPVGLAVFAERLRQNAAETVAFFTSQGVDLKVLSGDAPATVGAIARDAGVAGAAPALDGETLPEEPAELRTAVLSAPAVGRISPEGKRAVIDADGRRGSADPSQCAAGRQAVPHKDGLHGGAGTRDCHPHRHFPPAAASVHPCRDGHDRCSRVRARPCPERRTVAAAALPIVGRPIRDCSRCPHRRRHHRRIRGRPLRPRHRAAARAYGLHRDRRHVRLGGRAADRERVRGPTPAHRRRWAVRGDGPAVRIGACRPVPAPLL